MAQSSLFFIVAAGIIIGGAVGLLMGRAGMCSAESCNVKANLAFSVVGGAFFGGVLAWYLATKTGQ